MKRLLSSLLAIVFVIGVCVSAPITARASYSETIDNWHISYEQDGTTCVITQYSDRDATEVEIPASFIIGEKEYTVTDVNMTINPFAGCPNLETITLAEGNNVLTIVDGVLYNSNQTMLITYPGAKTGDSLTVLETATALATWALVDAKELKYIFYDGEVAQLGGTYDLLQFAFHYGATDHIRSSDTKKISDATCIKGEVTGYYCTVDRCDKIIETVTSETVDPDAHTEGEWEQKTPATCNAEGEMVKKCTLCGDELATESIEVLPHTMGGWMLDSAPTCVDNGLMHRSCTNDGCVYKEEAEITATGIHTPGEWEEKTPATCDKDGVKVRKCTVCQAECETGVITAQHTLGEWETTKNPTCKEAGERERKCTVENCEYKETESIDALAHTAGAWSFVKDSTCSEEGKLEKICTVCKDVIETATIPVKDHDFTEWEETKAPTCKEAGEEKRECKDCKESETREVEALGHDFSEEFTIDLKPTCTETGSKSKHCSRCEEKSEVTVIDVLGHDYENVDFTIDLEPTCTEAGSKSKHCTRCEEKSEITEIEATGHIDFVYETIKEATCTTAGSMLKKCKCGEELETITTSPKEHILSDWIVDKEATCTTAGAKHKECTLCEAVLESGVIDILGHTYGDWTITKTATCFEDGSKYRVCTVCEDKETVVIEKIAHKNSEVVEQKDATCLEDGYSGDTYCPDCNEIIEAGEVLKATGHTASDWITDKEASFTETGTQHKECTVCKAELETAVIDKRTLDTPNVTIENASNGIKVNFTQDEDALGYIVYSSQYNVKTKKWTGWENRGTLKATASSWVDKNVEKGISYRYTVRAVNGKFKSGYKESASLMFIEAPKATVTISTTGLLIKWNKIEGADSYIVYRSEMKDGKWSKWVNLGKTGEAKNSWLDDKTVSGVSYRYAIRTVDGKTMSGYIASASMVYLEQPVLKISNSHNGITGTWEKVDGAKGYVIYRSELVNGKWTKWVKLGKTKETAKSFTDKTVKSGSQYKYTLKAVNGSVLSTYRDSNTLVYVAEPVLKITNEANAISGSWNQVKGAKGYIIYRAEMKDGKWTKWVNLGTAKETAKTFTDKTVKTGVTYKYTVKAINGKYKSSYSDSNILVFLAVPTVKAANAATGVKVSWNKIEGATSYIVYRRELNSSKWSTWKNLGNSQENSFVDATAVSNAKYQYTVRAVNGESRSVYKASQTLQYLAAPTVTIEGTETGIKVSWTKVEVAKGYTVYRAILGEDGKWSAWQVMGTAKETKSAWIDKSTAEDITYRYTVRAINGTLKSAYVASEPLVIESEKEPVPEQPSPEQSTTEQDTNNAN